MAVRMMMLFFWVSSTSLHGAETQKNSIITIKNVLNEV
jgi:hypothetical protein